MEKTYKESTGLWSLDTDKDHILHRIGSDDYTEIRHIVVSDPDNWEEITAQDYKDRLSQAKEQKEYDTSVESLIRTRYSLSEEIALINNFNAIATLSDDQSDKAEQYASEYGQYQAYRAACKVKARADIEARKEAERLAAENRQVVEGEDVTLNGGEDE